ncbi:type I-E CRISPR-associated protein Cse2/CasB [Marivita sp. GX14005]|uniref:type I-E CRISPR-associated protein Cse2/CasB n=1 Tax=Marivita sp. GX14005 TaxID=2942276 RepID=UPI002019DBDB|nr:type I-E CRISPR-associated protein Cse2/CasB [Marivita sp. GX14005]MCL3883009.1 type I-E CRISPR-associated protein Cse2/CasB [Marivita sp. GX14005]
MSTQDTISSWWHSYLGKREDAAARGLAARLRRAASPVDVAAEPAVHVLAQRLRKQEQVIPVARILAEIRGDTKETLARRLGPGLKEPAISNARFERLIRSEHDALVSALRRVLPAVDRRCNVGRLGADLLYWNEDTRIRWTFDYYHTDMPGTASRVSQETTE